MGLAWLLSRGREGDVPSIGLMPSEGLHDLMLPQQWNLVTGVPKQMGMCPLDLTAPPSPDSWGSLPVTGLSGPPLKTERAEDHWGVERGHMPLRWDKGDLFPGQSGHKGGGYRELS